MPVKIAIIGSRGIPNEYGGFEQLAEYLSVGLVAKGHQVAVYNSHHHSFKESTFNGVEIIRCYDPEKYIGTAGQFIYDLNCILDARKRNFDVLLFLGYTSSSIWGCIYPKRPVILSNMDGLEWKRLKYAHLVRWYLKYAEKLAVKYSKFLIADSPAIQSYIKKMYGVESQYIAYGASICEKVNDKVLEQYQVSANNYYMLIARMEPENNIELILNGFHNSHTNNKFLVIGNMDNHFGRYIYKKFSTDQRILFFGAIYDEQITHTLKASCLLYFHGHSVGGTNPSLLEAMASKVLIAAHENDFNRAVIGSDGYYFTTINDVQELVDHVKISSQEEKMISNNFEKIKNEYNWQSIIDQYERFILQCFN